MYIVQRILGEAMKKNTNTEIKKFTSNIHLLFLTLS